MEDWVRLLFPIHPSVLPSILSVLRSFSLPSARTFPLEDDSDLGWESEIDDDSVTLQPRKGKKLRNAMIYIIQGSVKDFAGNTTGVKETFATRK